MKKVCFFIGNMNYSGGTERVTSILANELVKKNFEVSILSLSEGVSPFFRLEPGIKLDNLFSYKISMKMNFLSCCFKLRKYIKTNNIETLIIVDSILCIFAIPALIGIKMKKICWEHFNFNVDLGVKFRNLGRKLAAKYCDYVITLTKRDREIWQKKLKCINSEILSIPNPTPYENIIHIPNLDDKIILAVGRLTYQKGFDLLLEAWKDVCKFNNEWKLYIVGSGEDEKLLKLYAKNLGIDQYINFISATKDIEKYYRMSSYFCLSSRFEGFGMVILEAQSFGIPVISFNCDCGPSDLIESGLNGYLIPPLQVEKLSQSILSVINKSKENYSIMSKASLEKSKEYTIAKIFEKWLKII